MASDARFEIGSPEYQEALRQEAAFWEGAAAGTVDVSLATWRDPELSGVTSGDLYQQALDLAVARGTRILELGCGAGSLSITLARRGCQAEGIDISSGLIARGQREAEALQGQGALPGQVVLRTADLNRIELPAEAYDVVLACAVLHHVVDLDHLLGQVRRALKPGGTLICLDHMEPSVAGLLLRYALLLLLPTEIPYRRKATHVYNRVMARVYRRFLPRRGAPAAFTLPPHSPFEEVSGREAIHVIRRRFRIERHQSFLAFADIVAGHLRMGSQQRNVAMARRLRRLDDWLVQRLKLRGQTYFLVARKPASL